MRKYKTPEKDFDEFCPEELYVELLEDYYEQNPVEIDRFFHQEQIAQDNEWNGQMPSSYEREIQKRLKKINEKAPVDFKKYQSDRDLTPEEEQAILDNVGKNLPGSRALTKKGDGSPSILGSDEFEDQF